MSRIRTEQKRDKKELEIKEMKENISTLSKRLGGLDSVMDRQEQYSHRNCFLLHALEEESPGNADQCVIDMLSESISEAIY